MYRAIEYDNDFLAHYGVKGMKWGVRKATKKAYKDARMEKKIKYKDYKYPGEKEQRQAAIKSRIKERSQNENYRKAYKAAYKKVNDPNYDLDRAYLRNLAIATVGTSILLTPIGGAIIGAAGYNRYKYNQRARRYANKE